MRFVFTADPDEFVRQAGPFVEQRLECNVIGGVVTDIRTGAYPTPVHFAYGIGHRHEVAFAALRTPPRAMLASSLPSGTGSDLVAEWLQRDPDLPGVNSLPETARSIAAAWAAHTGGAISRTMSQAMHALTEVVAPARPAPGGLRPFRADELRLVAKWWEEFVRESAVGAVGEAESIVSARHRQGALYAWDHDGPVSMVVIAAMVTGVARIGPVYTPPEHRQHGYATNAVAALSRLALAGDAHTCMLYTDLANPTSNKIYAEVGYRRFADWEELIFKRP